MPNHLSAPLRGGEVAELVAGLMVRDSEPLIHKALAWALNCLIPHDQRAVKGFLTGNEALLAAITLREVRKKLG